MDPATILGIASAVIGIGSPLASLYVARRGGSFRSRPSIVSLGGLPLINGRALTAVYAVPDSGNLALTSLNLQLANPGRESIEDLTLTVVLPEILGGFVDEDSKRPTIELKTERGVGSGIGTAIQKVGIRYHIHTMIPAIHPLVTIGLSLPFGLKGTTVHSNVLRLTLKDGVNARMGFTCFFAIPIEIFLMAKHQEAQRFTVKLEVSVASDFRALVTSWLAHRGVPDKSELSSVPKKIQFWLRYLVTFKKAILVLPRYKKEEHDFADRPEKRLKPRAKHSNVPPQPHAMVTVMVEEPGSQRYALGYLAFLNCFVRPLARRKSLIK